MIITIDTIFTWINFIVVVGLIVYVVRRYGVIFVLSLIRQERDAKNALKQNLKSLQADCIDLQNSVKNQEDSFEKMQNTFKNWTQVVHVEQLEQEELLKKRKVYFERKQMQKVKSLQERKLIKEQLPNLIQEVEKDLQKEFSNDKKQAQIYTDKLLKFLEE